MRRIALHSILIAAVGALVLGTVASVTVQSARAADGDLVPDTDALSNLSPEELFLRASSSALQFESMREPSRELLVANYEESIPYLVTQLDTDGARERHALEDIFVREHMTRLLPSAISRPYITIGSGLLPKTHNGKIDRLTLQAMAQTQVHRGH